MTISLRRFRHLARCATLLVPLVAASGSCLTGGSALQPLPLGGHHVLFVGNSLTYANDLPATVAAIAASAGDTIRVMTAARPNLALIDHLNGASNALEAIRLGSWEYVVLQQGPTSTGGICQDSMVLWTRMFAPHIRAVGATPALYMVWPARDRLAYFDNVRSAYQEAAGAVQGMFLPAGEAWRSAWGADSTLTLYGGDGFHPSAAGSFLAALTIYERITGRDPRTLPAQAFEAGAPLALDEATVRALQAAAHDANSRFAAFPPPAAPAGPVPRAPAAVRC